MRQAGETALSAWKKAVNFQRKEVNEVKIIEVEQTSDRLMSFITQKTSLSS